MKKSTNLIKILWTILFICTLLFFYFSNVNDLYFQEDIINFENRIKNIKFLFYIVVPFIYIIVLLLIDYKDIFKKNNFVFYLVVFIILFFLSHKSILNGCLILNKKFTTTEKIERKHYFKIYNEKLLLYDQFAYLKEFNFPENVDMIKLEKSSSCLVMFKVGYFGIPFNPIITSLIPKSTM
ncbi:MAG TPA: hypothetical protein VL022_02045 [Moheibacter sp.]|nr:hypothetical protein [Moheibacter sp.]